MKIIIISPCKEDAIIQIYPDQNLNKEKKLDFLTFSQNEALKKIKTIDSRENLYAIFGPDTSFYNAGIKKTTLLAIDFLNDNNIDWDIINISSENNEIFTSQNKIEISEESSWSHVSDYMRNFFIKRIHRIPSLPLHKKYYMNTYAPMYALNLKNIDKIYNILCPIKFNNILINFLENLNELNLFFLNSNINKINFSANVNTDYDYNPTIFFDWWGMNDKTIIAVDHLFAIKIHKSLISFLTDTNIFKRLVFKINKKIINADFLKIDWSNASDFNIRNNLIDIQFSLKTSLSEISKTKLAKSKVLLEVVYLCPTTGNKINSNKEIILKKLTKIYK